MALAVAVGLLFSNNSGGGKNTAGEVFLQPAAAAGPDPFTESTATDTGTAPGTSKTGTSVPKTTEPGTPGQKTTEPGTTPPRTPEPGTTAPKTTPPKTTAPGGTAPKTTGAPVETRTQGGGTTEVPGNVTRGVEGSAPGLYTGRKNVSPCDVEKQIKALQADPSKASAFASVEGITAGQIPSYLRSLTPVQLSADTRVTNHGYRSGGPTSYQAILQSGTSVLVDSHGVPRTRCGCGNPLKEPVQQKSTPKQTGQRWASFQPQNVVVIAPSVTIINVFVIFDSHDDKWIARYRGDNTHHDRPTHRPPRPFPTVVVTPTPCVTPTGGGACAPTTPSSPSSPSSSSSGPSKSGSSTSPSESSASPSKSEPSKSESSKSESPSSSKSEPSKSESSKSESPSSSKSEPSKSESSKPESPSASKSESPKPESSKSEPSKSESPKPESSKPESPSASKSESPKPETSKAESPSEPKSSAPEPTATQSAPPAETPTLSSGPVTSAPVSREPAPSEPAETAQEPGRTGEQPGETAQQPAETEQEPAETGGGA